MRLLFDNKKYNFDLRISGLFLEGIPYFKITIIKIETKNIFEHIPE